MRSFWQVDQVYFFLLLVFSLIVLFIFYKNKSVALATFFVLVFILGGWISSKEIEKTKNLTQIGKTFQGNAVVEKVTPSSFGQNVIVKSSQENIPILIKTPQYPEYSYGDLLEISCVAKAIENLSRQQTGKDGIFDYKMYMAKEGVFYECEKSGARKIGEDQGNWIYAKILSTRFLFENRIARLIPAPYSALASGILFGGSGGLSKDVRDDFSRTGMTHIVAVSGYNVTIIAEYLILLGIFFGLWRKQAIWFALVGIVLFVIMIGLPASAVRAGVMSGILLWAMKSGRLANSQNAIIFAGAIMLAFNPLLLRWDVGFQLSFLATLGIVVSASFWEKSFAKKHKAFGISEIIMLSLSAQIFVLPIIAYNFQTVSLISLLANVFILPIIPLSMLLVFLVCVFGFIFMPLSMVFAWLAFFLLFYEIKLVHVLAQFPWASVRVENIGAWWVGLYYCMLCLGVYVLKKRDRDRFKLEDMAYVENYLSDRIKRGK